MKKSDIFICGFMYLFSFFFLYLTEGYPEPVRHYPHFVIGLLLLLTTVHVVNMFREYMKDHKVDDDFAQIFDGFEKKQFWFTFAAFIVFFILMYLVGFYIAALVYLLATLLYFRIRPLYIGMVLVGMAAIVYGTFDIFLRVPLPMGIILEEFL